jgi:hypothetical protein
MMTVITFLLTTGLVFGNTILKEIVSENEVSLRGAASILNGVRSGFEELNRYPSENLKESGEIIELQGGNWLHFSLMVVLTLRSCSL